MTAGPARARFWLRRGPFLVIAVALCMRVLYVGMATVAIPIRGDVNQYVLYAWNLSHRATFSTTLPDDSPVVPDSYRGPGYPALLAASMLLAGHADLPLRTGPGGQAVLGLRDDTWMRIALGCQVLLGTLSVALVMALGRRWLDDRWAIAAGALTATWPHLVAFTGVLLSETLFAACLLASLLLLSRAEEDRRPSSAALCGLCWGATCLVNPLVALFPFVIALRHVLARRFVFSAVLIGAFLAAPVAWAVRNAVEATGNGASQRLAENFVQGSWPQYHQAQNSRFENATSAQIMRLIDVETREVKEQPTAGLAAVGERFALDPGFFATWYLLQKPALLWDWSVRIGAGDIYFLNTEHSPFSVIPVLRWLEGIYRWSNPLLALLAALTSLVVIVDLFRAARAPPGLQACALLLVYVTAVHVALQAEPRYSVPYRPFEILLALTAIAWIAQRVRNRRASPAHDTGH